jgi:lipopolysaccharide export system permease protein
MKTLDRYLMRQIGGPFLFGVIAFVLLFVSANILFRLTEMVSQLGLSIWVAAELFLLWLPGFAVMTFPLATLVAILITFGRLSGDSELVAMYAGGVSFRRLVRPLLAFGLLVSIGTAAFNEYVVPACERRATAIEKEATLRAGAEYKQQVLIDDVVNGEGRVVRADKLDLESQEMTRPAIFWFHQGQPVTVTTAERAVWEGKDWKLIDGVNYVLSAQQSTVARASTIWARFAVSPKQLIQQSRGPNQMTYEELKSLVTRAHLGTVKPTRPLIELELALYHKLSIPFASLVFALIAPALGIRSHRGSGSIGMGLAILIGFAYYVIWNYLAVLAHQGGISPFWAAWLPNVVCGAVGVVLILRVRR